MTAKQVGQNGDVEVGGDRQDKNRRDGRLTILLVLSGVFLGFTIAKHFHSSAISPDPSSLQCRELQVVDDAYLQVHNCSDEEKSFADGAAPADFTPFFFQPVKINYADREMLMTVKGIGPSLAARILAYRESFGAFKNIGDFEKLKGVGQKKGAILAPQLSFDEEP